MAEKPKVKYSIGPGMSLIIIIVAILVELAQFLLSLTVVGEIGSEMITIFAGFGFWLWFMILVPDFTSKSSFKKIGSGIATEVIELIPFINDLPIFTLDIIYILWVVRKDDEKKAKEQAAALAKAQKQQQQRMAALYARQAIQAQAANDNIAIQAANDNFEQEEEEYPAAA